MMTKKMFTLSLVALSVSAIAIAAEYKEPEIKFKRHTIPSKEMEVADFGENYKVEKADYENDRQIASEEDAEKVDKSEYEKPQPWTFRNKTSH